MARTFYCSNGNVDINFFSGGDEFAGSYSAAGSTTWSPTGIPRDNAVDAVVWSSDQAHNNVTWPHTSISYSVNVTATTNMSTCNLYAYRLNSTGDGQGNDVYGADVSISTTGIKTGTAAWTNISGQTDALTDTIGWELYCWQNGSHSTGSLTINFGSSTYLTLSDFVAPSPNASVSPSAITRSKNVPTPGVFIRQPWTETENFESGTVGNNVTTAETEFDSTVAFTYSDTQAHGGTKSAYTTSSGCYLEWEHSEQQTDSGSAWYRFTALPTSRA
jgi:hypothetical protein